MENGQLISKKKKFTMSLKNQSNIRFTNNTLLASINKNKTYLQFLKCCTLVCPIKFNCMAAYFLEKR